MTKSKKKNEIESAAILEMPEEKSGFKEKIKKFFGLTFGVLLVLIGLFLTWLFLPEFIKIIEGLIGVIFILIGILIIIFIRYLYL
ncbi:MAG: hypothetical protein QXQ79_02840 [Candidatus Nanoarchaeia archaeon]